MTRRGSGGSRVPERVARSRSGTDCLSCGEPAPVLEGGEQRQGRFGTLVEVGSVGLQAVVAAAGGGVPHRRPCVVVAEEPGDGGGEAGLPTLVLGVLRSPGAGVGEGGDLERLLVEGGLGVVG